MVGLVIQGAAHHAQAFGAAWLHPLAGRHAHLEVARLAAVYLVQAVLLKKQHIPQLHCRAGKRPVAAHAHGVAVGRQPSKAVPVGRIAQLAGVNLVFLAAAPPQPVVALHHIVQLRGLALQRHRVGLACRFVQKAHHHNRVVRRLLQQHLAVQVGPHAVQHPAHRHGVTFRQVPANAGGAYHHIGGRYRVPQLGGGAVLFQAVRVAAGTQPVFCRVLRFGFAHGIIAVRRAVRFAQGKVHSPVRHILLPNGIHRAVRRVVPHPVREHDQPCPHAHKGFFAIAHIGHGLAAVIQLPVLRPRQRRLGAQPAGVLQGIQFGARAARGHQGVALACHVFHLVKRALVRCVHMAVS